ncbi:MAG: nitroreductase [Spirochaeta sp.]|nr:nitroreductase [Spirochaeta sp.]
MDLTQLSLKSRTYRRFDAQHKIDLNTLEGLIKLARCTPSAANMQPLKYILSCTPEWNQKIFSTLAWAGSLPEWPGPGEAEQPTGYIIILIDKSIRENAEIDVGIAVQTILLGATELGLGGCMFASVNRKELRNLLDIPGHLIISLVVAIGKPVEKVVLVDAESGASIKYYRDSDQTHYVPKRKIGELIYRTYSQP